MITIEITGTHEELRQVWSTEYADALIGKTLKAEKQEDGWYNVESDGESYTVPPWVIGMIDYGTAIEVESIRAIWMESQRHYQVFHIESGMFLCYI